MSETIDFPFLVGELEWYPFEYPRNQHSSDLSLQDRTSASCVSVVSANSRPVMAIAISKGNIATNGSVGKIATNDSVGNIASNDSVGMIAACGEDCAITVVKILASGALQISHILQVSRNESAMIKLSSKVTEGKSQNLAPPLATC